MEAITVISVLITDCDANGLKLPEKQQRKYLTHKNFVVKSEEKATKDELAHEIVRDNFNQVSLAQKTLEIEKQLRKQKATQLMGNCIMEALTREPVHKLHGLIVCHRYAMDLNALFRRLQMIYAALA